MYADPKDRKAYSKRYHALNAAQRNLNAKEKRLANKLRCVEYKGDHCEDCKQTFPHYVYDFHHIEPSLKEGTLGALVNWKWGDKIEKELDKCVMLCANCHRIRHHGEVVDGI